jgi:hypothetical protein
LRHTNINAYLIIWADISLRKDEDQNILMIKHIPILILSLAIPIISCTETNEVQRYRLLGTDPLDDIAVMEEHSEALIHWAQKDLKKAVLIHIDPHDSLEAIEPETIQQIGRLLKDKKWEELKKSRGSIITNTNYLFAAVQLGIIDKLYWVVPYRYFEDIPLAKEKIQDFLRTSPSGFKEDEIAGMRMTEGCLTGLLAGVDMHICSPRTLPKTFVPAIISMDASFLPTYAKEGGISKLRALKWILDYISFKQKILVSHAGVSYGIESGYTEAIHRYIGDQLIEGLGNPQILRLESPPELWQFRDNAENMLSGGEDKLVVEFLAEPLEKYPDDSALRLLLATAQVRLQKYDDAYKETDKICSRDKNYCYGFIYLAMEIKDNEWQKKFFNRAENTLPDSMYLKKTVSPVIEKN